MDFWEDKMSRLVCILNAIMVLPFAVSALALPVFTFDMFGLDLGAEGAGVARGYGATALGWGLACVLLRNSLDVQVRQAVLIASFAFNAAEVLLQLPIAFSGIASPMIWTTIVGHGVIAMLSAYALLALKPAGLSAG
jgi:hypothetical protein